jgi:Mrp family chromosome partitioning ATPase
MKAAEHLCFWIRAGLISAVASANQRKPAQTSADQLCPMLKYADSATLEHFSLTASCQTGQAKSTFSALALAGFQVATFPT